MVDLFFDSFGHLIPYDVIPIEIEQLEREFVTKFPNSTTRKELFEGYMSYIADFQQMISPHFSQWIDGSFITQKINPNDIDIVTFIEHTLFEEKQEELQAFKTQKALKKYDVDAYIILVYPENHKKYALYQTDKLQFQEDWSNTLKNRNGKRRKKGIIQIQY